MRTASALSLLGALLLLLASLAVAQRTWPPSGFHFGAAASAYQIEGATKADGRGDTIWDDWAAAGHIEDGSSGETVADHYYRFEEDAILLKSLGLSHYSLTVSWARVLPNGTLPVNEKGIQFYVNLVRALKKQGLGVYATLYHWELPSALQAKGGWLERDAVLPAFDEYARAVFTALAPEGVDRWFSMNEPRSFCFSGYTWGVGPPGRCKDRATCKEGNDTEVYICSHNALLAHARAGQIWRDEFASKYPKTTYGIVLDGEWVEPLTGSTKDIAAARRQRVFEFGHYAHPIFKGGYPPEVIASIPELPQFTASELALVKGSADIIGLDYYTAVYASELLKANESCTRKNPWWPTCVALSLQRNGKLIGEPTGMPVFYPYPDGLRKMLSWIWEEYSPPELLVTETGYAGINESAKAMPAILDDPERISYFAAHLNATRQAYMSGVNVTGFFAWSFIDNLEWNLGTSVRFGLVHVDFGTKKRTWKKSAGWYCQQARELVGYNGTCVDPGVETASRNGNGTQAQKPGSAGRAVTGSGLWAILAVVLSVGLFC